MKIASLYCPCNGREDNPLDHFEKGCGAAEPGSPQKWPIEHLRLLLNDTNGYHADDRLTATRILGCVRETAILDNMAVPLDVRGRNSARLGSIWHKMMEEQADKEAWQEVTIPPFPFGGYLVEGKVDKVRLDHSEIKDWKFHAENSQGFKFKRFNEGKPDKEGAAQLNLYRIGIAKSVLKVPPENYKPKLVLHHGSMVSSGGVAWFEAEQPLMSEEQILKMRPHDDEDNPGTQPFTVAELMKQHADFVLAKSAIDPRQGNERVQIEKLLAGMPLVGKGMWAWRWNKSARRRERQEWGDKCLRYCAAYYACMGLERKAGRPTPEGGI